MKNKLLNIGLLLNKIIAVVLFLIVLVVIIMFFVLRADDKVKKNGDNSAISYSGDYNEIERTSGNIVISYKSSPSCGTIEMLNNHFIINVYDDMVIEYGYVNDSKLKRRNIIKETYEELYNYAFSDAFLDLNEDLSDEGVLDGSYDYITIYFKDDTSKKFGGYSPYNPTFKKLESILLTLTD